MMPQLFALHLTQEGECDYGESGFTWPSVLSLNFESIQDEDGIYVLDDGLKIFLHINHGASTENLLSLFGVESVQEIVLPIDEVSIYY